jgi:hypothetical protein
VQPQDDFRPCVAVDQSLAPRATDTKPQVTAQELTTAKGTLEPNVAEPPAIRMTGSATKLADTESTFAELRSELEPETATTGPVMGQRLGARSAEESVTKPLSLLPEEPASMLAQRRQEGFEALADLPDLQAALVSSPCRLGGKADLVDVAADSPPRMRKMWEGYKVNTVKRADEGKAPLEFFEYVKARQASEERSLHGERTDAFARGADEILVVAPGHVKESGVDSGRVNKSGIDSVSFAPDPSGGRIKLLDNKALQQGSTVRAVSALQENLAARAASDTTPAKAGNLDEVVAIVRQAASQPEAPSVIKDVVLPRLQAASKAVNGHVANWQRTNPGKPLTDPKLQAEIGEILDRHGIDRVVTTAGGGPNVKLSGSLRQQGFKQE